MGSRLLPILICMSLLGAAFDDDGHDEVDKLNSYNPHRTAPHHAHAHSISPKRIDLLGNRCYGRGFSRGFFSPEVDS